VSKGDLSPEEARGRSPRAIVLIAATSRTRCELSMDPTISKKVSNRVRSSTDQDIADGHERG
jgi:hypothetical protein